MEYALAHQQHLRGLVISNMMSSAPAYNAYAEQVLMPEMDPGVLAEIKALEASGDIENPRYMELLDAAHYVQHMLRMPVADWPEPAVRGFAHINPPSTCRCRARASSGSAPTPSSRTGTDRRPGLDRGPGLVIGARYDTMDPAHMEMMAAALPPAATCTARRAATWPCTTTRQAYFAGLTDFLTELGRARRPYRRVVGPGRASG